MKHYNETVENVLNEVSSSESGLTSEEAKIRLERDGQNKLVAKKRKSIFRMFLGELANPMIIILLCAALISGFVSIIEEEDFVDAIIILVVVLINAILGVVQESKAEKAIEALQKMAEAKVKVLRDGNYEMINSSNLVIGDVVIIEAGNQIAADGRIIEAANMKIEESALTGESVPVLKENAAIEGDVSLGDRKNMVYMGSTCVYGRGKYVVTGIGMNTEMGKIAKVLNEAKDNETPLQKKLNGLSKILTFVVLGICLVVFAVKLLLGLSNDAAEADVFIDSFMVAVSLAVAAIPEGLAAVVTVVLSIGVSKMSKRNAIIRKLTAVETLGCAQIICSDKTGTLTQNKMTVVECFGNDKHVAMAMALASDAEVNSDNSIDGEPTEAALVAYALKLELNKNDLKKEYIRINEAPFDSERKMMSTVMNNNGKIIQFTKGAPDQVLEKCKYYYSNGEVTLITEEFKTTVMNKNKELADKALRVLAVSEKPYDNAPDDVLESDLIFIGLVGMIDPIRDEVKLAMTECMNAGIRPIMITGDHMDTARAIAKELGILKDGYKVISGKMLDAMSDEEFAKEFVNISVYARVQPEHKTRIVSAWQNAGYVTAMTGDGVNDAPSINQADIGIGMGITGTDVTKNVADMVLADDNFATIISSVEEGRRIYDNIRKAIQFLLGSNLSEVLVVFLSTLMGTTLLDAAPLLWVNLMTDTFPALALGVEPAEADLMERSPRASKDGLFSNGVGVDIIYQSILTTILVFISYFVGIGFDHNACYGKTMCFVTLSCVEIFHSLNMRSLRGSIFKMKTFNKILLFSTLGTILLTLFVTMVPFMADAFGFAHIEFGHFLVALFIGALIIPLVEIVKLIQRLVKRNK